MAESNFIDYVKILCRSGHGGAGSKHLHRAKYIPKGGPDGGDGGRGGHIFLKGNRNLWTLIHLKYQRHIFATDGAPGSENQCTGKKGEDRTIEVPCGTAVYDAETGKFLCDVTQHGQVVSLLKGGRGGLGNVHFKSATRQTPRFAQPGEDGVEKAIILELKLLADVGLVGFPNAGKSTLLNKLTGAEVYTMDRLFATLDPTTRSLSSPDGMEIMITDTVGFIRKLPHHLIDAFKSTLEEAVYADVIIHVVDSVNPRMEEQMQVVYETLDSLGIRGKPILTVYNKTDLTPAPVRRFDPHADCCLNISAATGEGLEELVARLEEEACRDRILIERNYSYAQAGRVDLIRRYGRLLELEYLPESIRLKAYVSPKIYGQI